MDNTGEMEKAEMKDVPAIQFDVFGYIYNSRRTYGLRGQDYTRYRHYCAKRLQRVRKSINMTQGSSKSFRKCDVTIDNASKPEHIEVLVLQAERAWAFAMDLRELYSRTEEPRQRYHLTRRLRSAAKISMNLATISAKTCDYRTALAAHAYWLQINSQLCFELSQWEAALDFAVYSRVISEKLALSGSSQQYALSFALAEALDPIIRLSAYQVRMNGAQQAQPSEIAKQWFESQIKPQPERTERNIPGFSNISKLLSNYLQNIDNKSNMEYENLCTGKLDWRGGSIGFSSHDLASLIDKAEESLASSLRDAKQHNDETFDTCVESPASFDAALSAYRQVEKKSRSLYHDSAAASETVQSSVSDAMASAYMAIQLYSICTQHAMAVARYNDSIKGILSAELDGAKLFARNPVGQWSIIDSRDTVGADGTSGDSDNLRTLSKNTKGLSSLPPLSRLVVIYDLVRKSIEDLQARVTDILTKLSPYTARVVCANQIVEEVAAASAYYTSARNYYSAALHTDQKYLRYKDALVLLDASLTTSIPLARSTLESLAKKHTDSSVYKVGNAAGQIWACSFNLSQDALLQIEEKINLAVPIVKHLSIKSSNTEDTQKMHPQVTDWYSSPTVQPQPIPNRFYRDTKAKCDSTNQSHQPAAVPETIPNLIDIERTEFVPVPIKPLFYDLASSTIEFDLDTITDNAGKQPASGNSTLGSIIGSLWGSR